MAEKMESSRLKYTYEELLERAYRALPEKVFEHGERWEIPVLNSIISGNRTFIKNFASACKYIRRDEKMVAKYLFKEVGTQGYIEGEVLVLLGKFSNKVINDKFTRFVKNYVLCPICSKPDTVLIKEDRLVFIKCEACGARNSVKPI